MLGATLRKVEGWEREGLSAVLSAIARPVRQSPQGDGGRATAEALAKAEVRVNK